MGAALAQEGCEADVTWLLDSAFDDRAFWGVVWEQEQHLVCRLQHLDRLIDLMATRAILKDYLDHHDALPHQIAAFVPDDFL